MANEIRDAFNAVFADGPSGSPTQPQKSRIRTEVGGTIQTQVDGVATGLSAETTARISADVAINTRIDGIVADSVTKGTWGALAAITGTRSGQRGVVTGPDSSDYGQGHGAGTHTDPVVGGGVFNVGVYSWSTSPAGWQWLAASEVGTLVSDVEMLKGNAARPQNQAGSGDTALAVAAIATNKDVDFGSFSYTLAGTNLGTVKPDRSYFGQHAIITGSGLTPIFTLDNRSIVDGLALVGTGKASGAASDRGVREPPGVGGSFINVVALRFGGTAVQIWGGVAANLMGRRITGYFQDNATAWDLFERGEYAVGAHFNITSTGELEGSLTTTGIRWQGGNNIVGLGTITFQAVGIDVVPGANDAHGSLVGVAVNNCDITFRYGNVNVQDFIVSASHFYAGDFIIGGQGLVVANSGFGTWDLIETSTADNSMVTGSVFQTMPATYTPNQGGASLVHYFNNLLPASVLGNSDWRKTTARSKRKRGTSVQSIAAGGGAYVDLNTVVKNSLQANTAFSKYALWDATNKVWNPLAFASPASDGRIHVDFILSIRRTDAGTLDKAGLKVQLNMGAAVFTVVDEFRPFAKGDVFTNASRETVICTLNGAFEKYAQMGVAVFAPTGHAIEIMIDAAATPCMGDVWGW